MNTDVEREGALGLGAEDDGGNITKVVIIEKSGQHVPVGNILMFSGFKGGERVKTSGGAGYLIIATPAAAAKMQSEADRALILSKFLDRRFREELVGSRIMLHWSAGEDRNPLSGIIDPRITEEGFYVRDGDDELWLTPPGQLVIATTAWTSLGKPEGSEPPRLE